MEGQEATKRTRRKISKEEKIAAIQEKIEELSKQIAELNEPPVTLRDVSNRIKELDLPLNDVMKAVEKMAKK